MFKSRLRHHDGRVNFKKSAFSVPYADWRRLQTTISTARTFCILRGQPEPNTSAPSSQFVKVSCFATCYCFQVRLLNHQQLPTSQASMKKAQKYAPGSRQLQQLVLHTPPRRRKDPAETDPSAQNTKPGLGEYSDPFVVRRHAAVSVLPRFRRTSVEKEASAMASVHPCGFRMMNSFWYTAR